MASHAQSQVLNGVLAAITPPLSDGHLRTLALVVGPAMLLDALDLVDKDLVARVSPPASRPVYQVASSSISSGSGGSYTLYPDLPGGYCPCAAFSSSVIAPGSTAVICKHLLACRLADCLGAWKDKSVSLKWVAGLATRFGAGAPPG
ncbi:hypothetical protein JCM3770_001963 [Rhodotorula araucariae]